MDARLGGRLGQDGLEFLLLGAGEFRRVLVPGVPGQHRAHPAVPPTGQPLPDGFHAALNHFSDGAHINASGGVEDRFCFHPHQHVIVRALLPPDQDVGFLRVTSTCMPQSYPKQHRKSTRNTVSFHDGHSHFRSSQENLLNGLNQIT